MWWVILYLGCAAFVLHHIAIAPRLDTKGRIVDDESVPRADAPDRSSWAPSSLVTDP